MRGALRVLHTEDSRAEAHATTTEHQLGEDAQAPFAEWLSAHGMAERLANVRLSLIHI